MTVEELEFRFGFGTTPLRAYSVAPGGQHFYALRSSPPPSPPPVTHINIIPNWFDELKAKVPAAR